MDWVKVVKALDDAAAKKQDEANACAVLGKRDDAQLKDEVASILRSLASAFRFGL